jgi:predicted O-linked N-acetylglucosamine transferase (SPINDLY family)
LEEALPEACAPFPSGGWQGLGQQQYRLIGVDLCLFSPIEAAFTCLSQAIPIVSHPTASPSSRGVASILSAMGLESLVREQQEEWLQAVALLVGDHQLYRQIRSQLIHQCTQSLLCNGELLARDLVAVIDLLRSTKSATA